MHNSNSLILENIEICTKQLQSLNKQLSTRNLERGLPLKDYKIPIHELKAIIKYLLAN
jgi:hypothetical protein